jgi:hypothetical protein
MNWIYQYGYLPIISFIVGYLIGYITTRRKLK